jgi:hypothetical protein
MTRVLADLGVAAPVQERPATTLPELVDHRRGKQERVEITRVGLIMPATLSYDDWAHTGQQLSGIIDSTAWCLGDWLVYGKRHYGDRYQVAIRAAGLQYQTLRNYAWVARRFERDRRRMRLTFQHHAEVASLPEEEQVRWLDAAEEHLWTTKQLRRQIQHLHLGGQAAQPTAVIPRIQVVDSRLRRWRDAAECVGTQFDSWVVGTLDHAAEQVLH